MAGRAERAGRAGIVDQHSPCRSCYAIGVASYRGYVLRRTGRWRADIPGALAILCGIAWVAGLKGDIRETFGAYVWGSLLLAAVFTALWWHGWRALRWEVDASERGVRMTNRAGAVRDLGAPRSIRHGQFSAMLTAGRARRNTLHLWVTVEEADGTTIVFQRAIGALDRVPTGWPDATPPTTRETFSSIGFDPAAFLAALGGPRDASEPRDAHA